MACTMVDLFNENTLFVFFFAMVAIYNYSALKEYQRMAIIYISVYALAALDIISIKLGLLFLIVALFCFFEIFTTDEMKFKILVNPIYKILDFMYIAIFQYSFLGICLALVMLKVKLPEALNTQNFIFRVLSWLFMVWTLTAILQQKYVIHTFGEMYKVFSQFPINKVLFNKKLDDAGNILVSIEDKTINEQISNFAQTYPTNLKASSNEALLFMRRYRFANCSCFSCCFKDAYPSSNVQ